MTFRRRRRGVRAVREAGHIAWLHHHRPWSRAYAIRRVGRRLCAVHLETGDIAATAKDVARLEPLILAHVQARPVGPLAGQACGEDPLLSALQYVFGPAGYEVLDVKATAGAYLALRADGASLSGATQDELRGCLLADWRQQGARDAAARANGRPR